MAPKSAPQSTVPWQPQIQGHTVNLGRSTISPPTGLTGTCSASKVLIYSPPVKYLGGDEHPTHNAADFQAVHHEADRIDNLD